MKRIVWTGSLLLASAFALVFAAASTNYINDPGVFASGSDSSTSGSYVLHSSIGQMAAGVASSPNFINASGFDALISNGGGGTVLDSDSFASGPGPNWSIVSGTWIVSGGQLQFTAAGPGPDSLRSNGPQTANAWIEVKIAVPSGTPVVAAVFRAQSSTLDGNNQYWVELDYAANLVRFMKDVGGVETAVATTPFTFVPATTYTLRVKFAGNDIRVLLDGAQKLCIGDSSITASGYYGLQTRGGANVSFDDWNVVTASNSIPVSNAGPDQNLTGGADVLLNGTGSSDGDGDPLNFTWTQLSGPTVTLSNATSAAPTFTPAAGINAYAFQLVVDDCLNAGAPDSVSVTVDAPVPAAPGRKKGGGGCGLVGLEAAIVMGLLRRRSSVRRLACF
jgi:hypothetical protein